MSDNPSLTMETIAMGSKKRKSITGFEDEDETQKVK